MCNISKKWYVRFADSKRGIPVKYGEYRQIREMAEFYGAIISDNFHPHGKTLVVSFPKHFV